MRIGHVQSSRPEFYDRNPSGASANYDSGAIAPHGATQRWAYTAPTGKKAFIQLVFATVQRVTAAAPAARAYANIRMTIAPAAALNALVPDIWDNVVGSRQTQTATNGGVLNPGDSCVFQTSDASTGGTVSYFGSGLFQEFDK